MTNKHDYYVMDDVVHFKLKGRASDTYAMVSIDKWKYVEKYDWYLRKNGYPFSYDVGKTLHRYVYKLILGTSIPKSHVVDHIDRNKLNNTNSNLRLATPQQNSFNRSSNTNSQNVRGIKKKSEDCYNVAMSRDGQKYEFKGIESEADAKLIYNLMAEDLYGEFATLHI